MNLIEDYFVYRGVTSLGISGGGPVPPSPPMAPWEKWAFGIMMTLMAATVIFAMVVLS